MFLSNLVDFIMLNFNQTNHELTIKVDISNLKKPIKKIERKSQNQFSRCVITIFRTSS